MLPTTIEATKQVLKTDPSLSPADHKRLMAVIRNHGKAEPAAKAPIPIEPPRLIRRAEAAHRLGCSLRAVDSWAQSGILHKVKLPGRVRAAGFREADLVSLIESEERPA